MSKSVLQLSKKANMFPEEEAENGGEPYLQILENPKSRGFRFRYTCEGPSHGGIPGASSDKNKKTFPAVRISNYQGYARIVVQLVTNEENPRLHPHSLVGKQCQNGICTVQCGPKDMTATFPNLGIQHVTKKNVASILEERYIAAEMQLSSINHGFPQEVQRNIKDEDRKRIAAKAQSEAKSIDLSVVRLMFIAYLPDSNGAFTIMLKPVISEAIFDSKAPNAATLKICRMDCSSGCAGGGDEVYLLCDKVQKDDIQVRFLEEDMQGNELWESYGTFSPTDVHRQFAIVFRTPAYKDQTIKAPVNVQVQLRRKSDGEVSEARPFSYLPNKNDMDMIDRKRRKVTPNYMDHIGSNPGYQFPGGAVLTPGFKFSGMNSGSGAAGTKPKDNMKPPSQQPDPQKCPLMPSQILNMFSVKNEPASPQNHFSQPSPQSDTSSMSEGSPAQYHPMSPSQASTTPFKQEYFAGTRVPIPVGAQHNTQLPQIQFHNRQIQTAPDPSSYFQQTTQVQMIELNQTFPTTSTQQQSVGNLQQMINAPLVNGTANMNGPLVNGTAQMNGNGMVNGNGFYSNQIQQQNFDQNFNPVFLDGDIISQALESAEFTFANELDLSANIELFEDIVSDAGTETIQPESKNEDNSNYASAFKYEDGNLEDEFNSIENDEDGEKTPTRTISPSEIKTELPDVEADAAASLGSQFQSLNLGEDLDLVHNLKRGIKDNVVPAKTHSKDVTSVKVKVETKPPAVEVNKSKDESSKKLYQTLFARMTESMTSALHDFSMTGDVRMLLALQRQLAVESDDNGDTVLHVAVIYDQLKVLGWFIDVVVTLDDKNDIINAQNQQKQTALQIAVLTDNVDAVVNLLKAGANPLIADENGNHSIHVASRHGNADVLSRLLRKTRNMVTLGDVQNFKGFGAFHLATRSTGNTRQCLLLLNKYGWDVNKPDKKSGKTALHMAVDDQNLLVASCLLSECDAAMEVTSYDNNTPLHISVAENCYEIATLLLACGAETDMQNDDGKTVSDLASTEKMRELLDGNEICFSENEECAILNDSSDFELSNLEPESRLKLCALLNPQQNGLDWLALADRLELSFAKKRFQNVANPADSLLEEYELMHGTVDGLRSALMNINRHDAVQVLNRACAQSYDSIIDNQLESEVGSI